MVIVDTFTRYVALNTVAYCAAFYAYTTLHELWLARLGLPKVLVTENGVELMNNETITFCHLYNEIITFCHL